MKESLDYSPETIYRLPWNLADNAISWLEPTSKCNIYCDGCYRENRNDSHKSIEEIKNELRVFEKNRKCDSISIAGGEPLTHPQIVEIVRLIKEKNWKPVINTNGSMLTPEMLNELKKAGVSGFTFHIDSCQQRPRWKGKNELELNELRLQFAEMLAKAGGITCSFNATVYPDTLKYVPDLVKWSQDHIDKVHIMVFIIYRMVLGKDFDYYLGGQKLNFDNIPIAKFDDERRTDVKAQEVVNEIRKIEPGFMPNSFLNGTVQPDSYKWLLSGRLGNKHQIFGYAGPRFMELVQTVKHLFSGSYLAYASPKYQRRGRLYFLTAPFDKGIRRAAKNYFKALFENPKAFFSRVHYQSVLVIQPIDILPNGDANMCDGCPDITVWNDKLIWSCRMEEQLQWGSNLRPVPKINSINNIRKNV